KIPDEEKPAKLLKMTSMNFICPNWHSASYFPINFNFTRLSFVNSKLAGFNANKKMRFSGAVRPCIFIWDDRFLLFLLLLFLL
ncbi:MAG TPA: hypothetical protein O0X38_07350, partial [Methanocorpusculum sp.]|nr:hypothetical protein [Methanocorpusculum sp.]